MGSHCVRGTPSDWSAGEHLDVHTPQPVTLNIYNVGTSDKVNMLNRLLRPLGAGAFHCGVEVFGVEWSYGDHDEGSGVFNCKPRQCDGHTYCESVPMGKTSMAPMDFAKALKMLELRWMGRDYDILRKNCCHFCQDVLDQLNVGSIPEWVTKLAATAAALQSAGEALEESRRSCTLGLPSTACCGCEPQTRGTTVEIISAPSSRSARLAAAASRLDRGRSDIADERGWHRSGYQAAGTKQET